MTRTVGSLTAHDIGHTVTVEREHSGITDTGKLWRVEHLQDGRTILQIGLFPGSHFSGTTCEVEGT